MNSWVLRREAAVSVLILDRPPINSLDREALEELGQVLEEIKTDRETRVLLITGGIEGIFCSGGDLKYWRRIHNGDEVSRVGRNIFSKVQALPKATIAAINGQVIGDGLALALACDLRYAATTASFRLPELAYGFIPGWGLIGRLINSVGRTHASEFLFTGQPIDAPRALTIGLVNGIFPAERLEDEVIGLGLKIATFSPAALRAAKCALRGGDEKDCFEEVWNQKDWQEGIDALFSKRKPIYGLDGKGGENCDHIGRIETD